MTRKVSSDQSYFWHGYVEIQTDLSLEEAAQSISRFMLGGAPFGGKKLRIRDELDAVFVETFGIRFVLVEQPEDAIILECHSTYKLYGAVELDLSGHIVALLGAWPDGTASILE